jgi:hypothetical protein
MLIEGKYNIEIKGVDHYRNLLVEKNRRDNFANYS